MNDLISRQAVIDAIEHANGIVYWNQTLMESLVSVVKSVPTIDPVKHGKWHYTTTDIQGLSMRVCSECGFQYPFALQKFNYCPTCGARMDKQEEEK